MRNRAAALLMALLLIACGRASTGSAVRDAPASTEPLTASAPPGDPYQVTCTDDQRPSTASYDAVPEAVGAPDAATAVQEVLPGELGVRTDQVQRLGSVGDDYRGPGDTYTVMGVRNEAGGLLAVAYVRPAAGGGWLVDTLESCGGGEHRGGALRLRSGGGRAGLVSGG